ncbi:MAG: hypothetical protein KDH15_12575 [Rhodocyclaceae bacterium]|nr:hypothetical protein [Rhodocyclaceae bacterium]
MSRISSAAMVTAIRSAQALDMKGKEQLADEVFHAQPNLLASVLVLPRLGVALPKVEFALDMLFVCFLAMKASKTTWPLITEADQDRQLQRSVAIARFGDVLGAWLRHRSMQQYIADHPEQELAAYVMAETSKWLGQIAPEDSDKHVMLAIWNLVNCIGFISITAPKAKTPRRRSR